MKEGITLKDLDELRALIDRLNKYTGELDEANSNMLKEITSAEEWFQGNNYDSFRDNWVDASDQIKKFLGQAPDVINYLEKVYLLTSDLLNLR